MSRYSWVYYKKNQKSILDNIRQARNHFMLAELSIYACALCEVFRYYLSMPSITEHSLCEDFPILLLGGTGVSEIWQRTFRISRYMGVLTPE